jgi:hypothetical protein
MSMSIITDREDCALVDLMVSKQARGIAKMLSQVPNSSRTISDCLRVAELLIVYVRACVCQVRFLVSRSEKSRWPEVEELKAAMKEAQAREPVSPARSVTSSNDSSGGADMHGGTTLQREASASEPAPAPAGTTEPDPEQAGTAEPTPEHTGNTEPTSDQSGTS